MFPLCPLHDFDISAYIALGKYAWEHFSTALSKASLLMPIALSQCK